MDINKKAYATNTEMLLICLFMYMYNFFLQICRTACLYTKKNTIHITNRSGITIEKHAWNKQDI